MRQKTVSLSLFMINAVIPISLWQVPVLQAPVFVYYDKIAFQNLCSFFRNDLPRKTYLLTDISGEYDTNSDFN